MRKSNQGNLANAAADKQGERSLDVAHGGFGALDNLEQRQEQRAEWSRLYRAHSGTCGFKHSRGIIIKTIPHNKENENRDSSMWSESTREPEPHEPPESEGRTHADPCRSRARGCGR